VNTPRHRKSGRLERITHTALALPGGPFINLLTTVATLLALWDRICPVLSELIACLGP
jgi:hypothetical protein